MGNWTIVQYTFLLRRCYFSPLARLKVGIFPHRQRGKLYLLSNPTHTHIK